MVNILRLIFALCLAFVSTLLLADVPQVTYYQYVGSNTSASGTSPAIACQKMTDNANAANPTLIFKLEGVDGETCVYGLREPSSGNGGSGFRWELASRSSACPANSAVNAVNSCTCSTGFAESGGQCVVKTPPVNDCQTPNELVNGECMSPARAWCSKNAGSTDVSREVVRLTNKAPTIICVPSLFEGPYGCSSTFERDFASKGDDGKWYNRGTAKIGADMCNLITGATGDDPLGTTPDNTAPMAPKAECESGQPGMVNGTKVCLPYPTKNGVITESNGTTKTDNPDGSSVTEKKDNSVSCNSAGVCNITTVTTTTNTSVNGTTSTQQSTGTQQVSKATYCASAAGKTDSACSGTVAPGGGSNGNGTGGSDGSFSGSCSADFTCSGDAVQCATARASWKTYCEASTLNDAAKNGLAAAMAKAGTDQSSALDTGTTNLGPAAFDQTDALGGGSCSIDKTVSVMGQTLVLPLSVVCPYLHYAGLALVAVSLIGAALIVFKT